MAWQRAEVLDILGDVEAWEMYAAADPEGSEHPLRHFGPLGYAEQDASASRVVRVLLVPTEEPHDGDYWAWLDHGAIQPSCIGATEQAMTRQFLLGEDAPGPREEERIGLGRILRLRVALIEDIYLRSGRRNWKISSAL